MHACQTNVFVLNGCQYITTVHFIIKSTHISLYIVCLLFFGGTWSSSQLLFGLTMARICECLMWKEWKMNKYAIFNFYTRHISHHMMTQRLNSKSTCAPFTGCESFNFVFEFNTAKVNFPPLEVALIFTVAHKLYFFSFLINHSIKCHVVFSPETCS